MLEFLLVGALVLAAVMVAGVVAIPLLAIGAVIWLVLLPVRWLFKLVFWLGGALLGLLIAPIVLIVVAVAVVGAFVTALLALLAPLTPLVLLALLAWGAYRIAVPRAA